MMMLMMMMMMTLMIDDWWLVIDNWWLVMMTMMMMMMMMMMETMTKTDDGYNDDNSRAKYKNEEGENKNVQIWTCPKTIQWWWWWWWNAENQGLRWWPFAWTQPEEVPGSVESGSGGSKGPGGADWTGLAKVVGNRGVQVENCEVSSGSGACLFPANAKASSARANWFA